MFQYWWHAAKPGVVQLDLGFNHQAEVPIYTLVLVAVCTFTFFQCAAWAYLADAYFGKLYICLSHTLIGQSAQPGHLLERNWSVTPFS